jgi:hypothetical protein
VNEDVRGLDVRRELFEGEPSGDDAPLRYPEALEHPREPGRVRHRSGEQEADPRVVVGGPGHRPGHGLDPLLGREKAEGPDHDMVVGEAQASSDRVHRCPVHRLS